MDEKELERITSQYRQDPVTKKIERVAAYVRVSTQEQKLHGISLDAQKQKLAKYAAENGMRIVDWYVDEGVSGRKLIKNRPELQRMIQDAEKGQFDRIIFIKLDRFFRSVAEYHEAMKRLAPVVWTTTEEEYDLTTANGRMLVNMKLTIAEMEADMAGERIDLVNEYKLSTGQPLSGSQPFGFTIASDTNTGRKKVIRDPETEDILRDLLDYYELHQSKRGAITYLKNKHHVSMSYESFKKLIANPMLHGAYRDNPVYCEAYMDKERFDRLQVIAQKNVKDNTAPHRDYIFSGLIVCPVCGGKLKGSIHYNKSHGKLHLYKRYKCQNNAKDVSCSFNKAVMESTVEGLMLKDIDKYFEDAKVRVSELQDTAQIQDTSTIEEITVRIDRLNYSWQTGKIRTVEKYEKDYAELLEMLEEAEAELGHVEVKDFGKIEAILQSGWRVIYDNLDDANKRAFWRSFVKSIEIDWSKGRGQKEIVRVNFF